MSKYVFVSRKINTTRIGDKGVFVIPSVGKNISVGSNNQTELFPNQSFPTISPSTLKITIDWGSYFIAETAESGMAYEIKMGNDISFSLFKPGAINTVCKNISAYYAKEDLHGASFDGPPIENATSGFIENATPGFIKNKNFVVAIKLPKEGDQKEGDIYRLYLPSFRDPCNSFSLDHDYVSLEFVKTLAQNSSNDTTGSTQQQKIRLNDCIEVPRINISGQTLVDGSDIGQMIFTILDKYTYYEGKVSLNNKNCHLDCISEEDLKKTIFDKSCPKMVNVFIGEGETLYIKVDNAWNNSTINYDLEIFYGNVIRYGMLRYILSKLIYGNFNINYLKRKYYNKFLRDLSNSRFCNFVNFFEDPTYSEFYKFFN